MTDYKKLILALVVIATNAAAENPCTKVYNKVYWKTRGALYTVGVEDKFVKRFLKSFYLPHEYFKAAYAPVTVPYKMIQGFRKHAETLKRYNAKIKKSDYVVVPIKYGVDNSHYLIASYLLNKDWEKDYVTNSEFLAETREFENKIDSETYLILNYFDPQKESGLYNEVSSRAMRYRQQNKNIIYLENISAENLHSYIQDHVKATGKPVYGIEWNTHGSPASISRFDIEAFVELMSKNENRLIHKDGQLRFFACSVACGDKGKEFVHQVNQKLFDNEGGVYGAEHTVSGEHDFWVKNDPTRVGLKYPPIYMLLKLINSTQEPSSESN